MAVDVTVLSNGIEYEGAGREVLDGLITDSIDHNDLMTEHKSYKSALGFTDTTLLSPDQKFSSKLPNGGLKGLDERGTKAIRDFKFGPKKGLSQREVGEKFVMSYLMGQWAKKAQTLSGAPDSVQAELVDVAEQAKDLISGYDIEYAQELVQVQAKGFSVTATEGPGSACARDGEALFSAAHELTDGSIFSNLVTGLDYNDIAVGQTKLQEAIDAHKKFKLDNGKKMAQPKGTPYTLECSRLRETYWLEVLNNGSDKAGTGSNSAKENTFSFRNNMVQVVVIDLLGDADTDGNTIGSDDMCFLKNPTGVKKMKALRCAELYTPRVKTYENDETDETSTGIRAIIGAGHFDAEFSIVGMNV